MHKNTVVFFYKKTVSEYTVKSSKVVIGKTRIKFQEKLVKIKRFDFKDRTEEVFEVGVKCLNEYAE